MNVAERPSGATGAPVLLFAALACLSLGLPRTMLRAVTSTLFLSQYPASSFAYVYLVVAALIPVTTLIFLQVEKRLSPLLVLLGLELVRLLAALALWVGFTTSASIYMPVVGVIWVEIDFVLSSFMFWGLAGLCITITETKMAYPRMAAGEQVGSLLIGLASPLVLIFLAPANFFWISALSIAAGLAIILRIAARFPALRQGNTHETSRAASTERPPPFNRQMRIYLGLILGAAFFSNVSFFVLDNLFFSEVEKTFADEKAMASFLSIAFGAAGGATLLFSLFVAPRVLSRFGIGMSVSSVPAVLTALALCLIAVFFVQAGVALLPFAVVTLMRLSDDGIRASIYRPAIQTLYQPIPPAQRIRALVTAEGYAEPLGIAGAGGALLLLARFTGFETYQLTILLLAATCPWLVITYLLRRGYISALSLAVSRRQNIETGFSGLTGDEAKRLVLQKLASDQIADRLSAADMLRHVDPEIYRSMVPEMLRTGEAALVRQVLPDLPALEIGNIASVLRERLQRETDAEVSGQLVLALARSGDSEGTAMLSLQSAKSGPLQGSYLAALAGGDFGPASDYAGTRMRLMSKAPDAASRRVFLAAAWRSGSADFDGHMIGLFDDLDPETRRAAFHAAGRTGRSIFLLPLAERLATEGVGQENANAIARALAAIGARAIPILTQAIEQSANRPARVAVAGALGLVETAEARNVLLRFIDDAVPGVSHAAAMSLWKAHVRLDTVQSKAAFQAVEKLLRRAASTYQAQADFAALPGAQLLHDGLQHRITQLTTQCFVLAALTHGIDSLKSVHLESSALRSEEKSVAIELVDSLLPSSLRQLCSAIVADLTLDQRMSRIGKVLQLQKLPPDRRLAQLVTAEASATQWIRACALSLAAETECGNAAMLIAATRNEDGLVGETARHFADAGEPSLGGNTMSLSTIEKVLFLKSVNLFKSIPDEYLAEFAPVMLSEQYGPGEVIMTEGEFGASLYIIVSGEVEIILGGRSVDRLGQRAVVGELAALDPEKRTATVRALGECHVMALSNQHIGSLMAAHPGIAEGIIRELCTRLRGEHALKRQRVAQQ